MRQINNYFVITFFLIILFFSKLCYCDIALKDLKNVYLEYSLEIKNPIWQMKDDEKREHKEKFSEKLEKIGFNIVNDLEQSDVRIDCCIQDVKLVALFGWQGDSAKLDFVIPQNDLTIASFKSKDPYASINKLENMLIKKIVADYESGDPKYKIDSNGKHVKIIKKRYMYTVLGKKIIYEGEENLIKDLWRNPTNSVSELKTVGDEENSKAIAILVYRTYMKPFATITWFGSVIRNRTDIVLERIKNQGIKLTAPKEHNTIADTYGYLIRYDIKNKKYGINYFSKITDGGTIKLKKYTVDVEETNKGDQLYRRNRQYHRDLSYLLSERIVDYFVDNNYRVINLTSARAEFNNLAPQKIVEKVKNLYNIDKVLLVPYTAYTRWIFDRNRQRITTYIGFQLGYAAFMFGENDDEPLFKFGEDVKPAWSEASYIELSKINFFSAEKDETGELTVLKDGVIDDVWIVGKTLKKFSGYEKGLTEKVGIGGKLFTNLSKEGY